MKKIISILTISVIMLVVTSASAFAKCGEVSIAEMNWKSGAMLTSVMKFLLEEGYGCKVTKVPSATITSVTSVAETGKPDVIIELWVNSATVYTDLEKQGKAETLSAAFQSGGREGWWVPKYLTDKHPELKTIEGVLANPDLVGGRFHNCPVGWGCRIANDSLKVALELEKKGFEVFDHGSGETLAASIASAYADKKPWFGYYWGPTAILGKYKMSKVSLGKVDQKIHKCNQNPDCTTSGVSDYPAADVFNVATTTFTRKEPSAANFLRKASMPNNVLNILLAWQEKTNASADEAAAHFITNYKDIWSSWLNRDARKKLAPLL